MGTSTRRLQDPVAGRPGGNIMGVLEMSAGRRSYIFFKLNSQTY